MEFSQLDTLLRVIVEEESIVHPAEATEKRSMYLSNIDRVLVFTLGTLHFFSAGSNTTTPFEDIVQSIKTALSKLLVHYDFLAGRLKLNTEDNRLEVDCSGAGALFVSASTDQTLQDLGDITYPNPSFVQFLPQRYKGNALDHRPLCFLQVTRFKCGGFVIGLGINHTLLDGIAIANFLKNLASVAAGKGLAVPVYWDRRVLKARCPPKVDYEHPELLKLDHGATLFNNPDDKREEYEFKLIKVDGSMVKKIKALAYEEGKVCNCSSFEAVVGHVWRARTMAMAMDVKSHQISRLFFAVDVRRRMNPPLPAEYAGNAVLFAYATASVKEMEEGKLWRCVERVQDGVKRMTDDYIRSVIDWGEVNHGIPGVGRGDGMETVAVSSWWRLGFEKVEYPWGKPFYCGPVIHSSVEFIFLLPTLDEHDDGVNVFLALKPLHMAKFCHYFNI